MQAANMNEDMVLNMIIEEGRDAVWAPPSIFRTQALIAYHAALRRKKTNNKKPIPKIFVKNGTPQNKMCAICHETPEFNELLRTSCNHHFCFKCYEKWYKVSINGPTNDVSCPNCRHKSPKLQKYVEKFKKVKKKPEEVVVAKSQKSKFVFQDMSIEIKHNKKNKSKKNKKNLTKKDEEEQEKKKKKKTRSNKEKKCSNVWKKYRQQKGNFFENV